MNYQELLDTYQDVYVPGEKRSPNYEKKMRLQSRLKHRMLLVDELVLESKYLVLSKNEIQTVKYLVEVFNDNFKYLHRQASDETIILAFIFYQKKLIEPRLRLKNYSITKKYNLTDTIFQLILCRISDYFMSKTPIQLRCSNRRDHDELIRGKTP